MSFCHFLFAYGYGCSRYLFGTTWSAYVSAFARLRLRMGLLARLRLFGFACTPSSAYGFASTPSSAYVCVTPSSAHGFAATPSFAYGFMSRFRLRMGLRPRLRLLWRLRMIPDLGAYVRTSHIIITMIVKQILAFAAYYMIIIIMTVTHDRHDYDHCHESHRDAHHGYACAPSAIIAAPLARLSPCNDLRSMSAHNLLDCFFC